MWAEWSPRAFARADAEKKPVLLSLVTAWSDECASMDATTYADSRVESLIDERFVAVRVDADRRPDINERYNLGGWPSTVFLTPAGDVLSGGTYFEAERLIGALGDVADAYRDRADEIHARATAMRNAVRSVRLQPDNRFQPDDQLQRFSDLIGHFRSVLIGRFDAAHGGFGGVPKLPHPHALMFALSLAGDGDAELAHLAIDTLNQIRLLWDPAAGGFYRYSDNADWTQPGTGKTLEDNAALLHVYVEAAHRLPGAEWLEEAAAIVRWVRGTMADETEGGFFNAVSSKAIDRTMYVDRNAMMAGAFIRAAALFDDIWLRDLALKALEAVVVPTYMPGDGVGHVAERNRGHGVRGLLTDNIHAASALIWAHAATGHLPYSMLAAEVIQFAIRTMWDESAAGFRDRVAADDPVVPFELNCHAACVLDRIGVLTGDAAYQERARRILDSLAPAFRQHDLFGAPYAVALREISDRRPPAGLELSPVDWQIG
jgi:uncharacterized protein YyaL (SSP411 family)